MSNDCEKQEREDRNIPTKPGFYWLKRPNYTGTIADLPRYNAANMIKPPVPLFSPDFPGSIVDLSTYNATQRSRNMSKLSMSHKEFIMQEFADPNEALRQLAFTVKNYKDDYSDDAIGVLLLTLKDVAEARRDTDPEFWDDILDDTEKYSPVLYYSSGGHAQLEPKTLKEIDEQIDDIIDENGARLKVWKGPPGEELIEEWRNNMGGIEKTIKRKDERNMPTEPGDYRFKCPDGTEEILKVFGEPLSIEDNNGEPQPVEEIPGVWSDRLPTFEEMEERKQADENRREVLETNPVRIGGLIEKMQNGPFGFLIYKNDRHKSIGKFVKRLVKGEDMPDL